METVHLRIILFTYVYDFAYSFLSKVLLALSIDAGLTFNPDRAISLGLRPMQTSFLLVVMGISNTLGKLITGLLMDAFSSRISSLTCLLMIVHTVAFGAGSYLPSLAGQAVMFGLFGFTLGAYFSTSTILLK